MQDICIPDIINSCKDMIVKAIKTTVNDTDDVMACPPDVLQKSVGARPHHHPPDYIFFEIDSLWLSDECMV